MKERPKLDRIDINILAQLQQNSDMTNVTLAEAVGLSPSPCLQRVKRLEKAGYIQSYAARINLAKLSDHVVVFTEVTLNGHRRDDFIKFEAEIRRYESIQECHLVSGGYDYLLKFVARNIAHYQEIVEDILERNIGVKKYFSYVVIKSLINKDSVPLKSILPDDDL
ncbi:Lrp/AsnC family transcriptional regulator [Pelagibius sp. Alg239-R121]|uniref:Lrp/AsnC family transcriptional regulator n=1 Tax=Pelagibius sp. Alg239-R121 TaxID=2993448 RepID=UPI0024A708E1|nr:winged helix-turn-helix transcriptional regulator [Pelagibius sp. Alg239-R121]